MKKVRILAKKRVFDDVFKIDEATLQYEQFDGRMSPITRRLTFERGDAVAAIIFNKDTKEVLLVNQFRYPTYENGPGWLTETVAGMVEEGETPEKAVQREMVEETHYTPTYLERIATFYVSPGGTSEQIVLFYAETDESHAVPGSKKAAEPKDIYLERYSLPALWSALDSGRIIDAKTLIAVLWLRSRYEFKRLVTA